LVEWAEHGQRRHVRLIFKVDRQRLVYGVRKEAAVSPGAEMRKRILGGKDPGGERQTRDGHVTEPPNFLTATKLKFNSLSIRLKFDCLEHSVY
jgi:hypothetical protein